MNVRRSIQITESHCGPAVIQMLLSNLGIEKSQEEITEAANARKTIEAYGTRVDQLALAVHRLAPQVSLYYKMYSSIADIDTLLREYNLPVAVNWQGMFYENEEEEDVQRLSQGDYGHYSVVTRVDYDRKALIIVDPYKDFAVSDRIIEFYKFVTRWWDIDPTVDSKTKKKRNTRYEKLLFVVSPHNLALVENLGFKTFY